MEQTRVLLELIFILAAAKVGSEIAERFGQPAVLGELILGIVLGLTVFPASSADRVIVFISEVGVIILLFEIGLESDFGDLLRVGATSALVAVIGVVAPLVAGYAVAVALGFSTTEAIFVGATLTATSIGITARVLSDLHRMATPEARIILGAAVIDDILGLTILSLVLAIGAKASVLKALQSSGLAILLLIMAMALGMRAAPYLIQLARAMRTRGALITAAFLFCLTMAVAARQFGMEAIIGAFAAGLVLASTDAKVHIQNAIKPLSDLFVPVFFVLVGMRVGAGSGSYAALFTPDVLLTGAALSLVAIATKLLAGLGAIRKRTRKFVIGIGMIPRGEVGLIFASIGLERRIISPSLYTAIILVVVITTMVTPIWLKRAMRKPTED